MEPRESAAMQIVYRYMAISAGAALIPVAVDVVVLAGIHVTLIRRLCEHYKVDFSEHTARNILIAVIGSVVPGTIGSFAGRKVLGMLPTSASVVGWVLMSASSAAFSYAIGRLFIHHFEAGGTLLSFDAHRIHEAFRHLLARPSPSAEPAA